jgi:hypothetical protein
MGITALPWMPLPALRAVPVYWAKFPENRENIREFFYSANP